MVSSVFYGILYILWSLLYSAAHISIIPAADDEARRGEEPAQMAARSTAARTRPASHLYFMESAVFYGVLSILCTVFCILWSLLYSKESSVFYGVCCILWSFPRSYLLLVMRRGGVRCRCERRREVRRLEVGQRGLRAAAEPAPAEP